MKLENKHIIYFIGIGGIGMSALARYFHAHNKLVCGYDKTHSAVTKTLEDIGIIIHFDDQIDSIPEQVFDKEKTLIVYTPAVPKEHQGLNYFMKEGFEVKKRSEVLGAITQDTYCFAVAGTHGKTTTSTILGHILHEAGLEVTSFLGGISENYNSNLILGGNKISVVEADEFDRSFLRLSPNVACITSMDADHLDIYGVKESLTSSFVEFSEKVSDKLFVRKGLPIEGITYGINEEADYSALNIRIENGSFVFDVKTPSGVLKDIESNLPGKHNVLNTVVALAMADSHGVEPHTIAKALKNFKGVQRRFSYKIKTATHVLIDDYAHHPTEINAVVDAVRELYPNKKITAVFQPHLFSRTKDFADDFADSLGRFDALILLDIYPAREQPLEGITSNWLLEKVGLDKKQLSTKSALIENIRNTQSDVVVMIGAGDIGELVENVRNSMVSEVL